MRLEHVNVVSCPLEAELPQVGHVLSQVDHLSIRGLALDHVRLTDFPFHVGEVITTKSSVGTEELN